MLRPSPTLGSRFLAAVELAVELHAGRRPGTEIPYMAHLLVVAGLVLEDGGGEDEAIAAMLHDSVEDGGGRELLQRLELKFGARVAEIVAACSDSLGPLSDRRSWRERKADYLAHLPEVADDGVLRVVLADKVHNSRSIVRDYRADGDALWRRFPDKSAADQLWYYGELLAFFYARRPGPLVEDLQRATDELADLLAAEAGAALAFPGV
ncbi:MAG TPA: HD domain-containing protein [Solirubrobacteraceae bacterium]